MAASVPAAAMLPAPGRISYRPLTFLNIFNYSKIDVIVAAHVPASTRRCWAFGEIFIIVPKASVNKLAAVLAATALTAVLAIPYIENFLCSLSTAESYTLPIVVAFLLDLGAAIIIEVPRLAAYGLALYMELLVNSWEASEGLMICPKSTFGI